MRNLFSFLVSRNRIYSRLLTWIVLLVTPFFIVAMALVSACLTLIVLLILPILHLRRGYDPLDRTKKSISAFTKDGWELPIFLTSPLNGNKNSPAAIVCHGIGVNSAGMDLSCKHSIVEAVARAGYRVYNVNLRSALYKKRRDYSFDDIVDYDIPAILHAVCKDSKQKKIFWIAHSMGGMVFTAYMGKHPKEQKRIKGAVFLGVPGKLTHLFQYFPFGLKGDPSRLAYLDFVHLAHILRPLGGFTILPWEKLVYNPKVVKRRTIRSMLHHGVATVSPGLFKQLKSWMDINDPTNRSEYLLYINIYKEFKIPLFCIAGGGDKIAPPQSAEHLYHHIGSKDKSRMLVSKEQGFSEDYCHTGLVLADKAPDEIFPAVVRWLNHHKKELHAR